ncbi:MAG: hypothetical protein PHN85_03105, partial [Kiritimatiellae bacterium]|nr:hypothetical protein [Kiritimatiellia bacterium]
FRRVLFRSGSEGDVALAADLSAAYSDGKGRSTVTVRIAGRGQDDNRAVAPRPRADFGGCML